MIEAFDRAGQCAEGRLPVLPQDYTSRLRPGGVWMAHAFQVGIDALERMEQAISSRADWQVGHAHLGAQIHSFGLCPFHAGHAGPTGLTPAPWKAWTARG